MNESHVRWGSARRVAVAIRRWGWLAAAVASLAASRPARAQQSLAAPESVVVPPQKKVDPGISYPERALRERFFQTVVVELVLEIDAEGHVSKASVEQPSGHGFDEAAVAAAQQLVFTPATRDGRPVAAKIKFRYEFTPPPPVLAGRVLQQADDQPVANARVTVRTADGVDQGTRTSADGSWSLPGLSSGVVRVRVTAAGTVPAETNERLEPGQETNVVLRVSPEPSSASSEIVITVTSDRPPREVSKRVLGRDEIMHSAGTQGDALLSVQNLPGIARPPPFSGALVVRGSAPDDTAILVDGTEVPLAYHFGGLSSVVPTELLNQLDFYPGNFSARYGRKMGGIVDVQLRPPREQGYHVLVENSVLGARGLVEGPLGKGWSFFAAGQRSWLDLLISPLLKAQGASQTALPHWADYQLALRKDFDPSTSFRVLFFGSDDGFDIVSPIANSSNPNAGGALSYHTSFWRLQGNFESELSSRTRLRWNVAYGQDRLALHLGNTLVDASLHPLTSRGEVSQQIATGVRGNLGLDLSYQPYDFALQLPPESRPGEPSGGPGTPPIRSTGSQSSFQPGLYAEFELTPWLGGRVVPGLRADYDSTIKHWDVSPRINARQDLRTDFPRTTLKAGAGFYYQPPSQLETAPRLGQTGLVSSRALEYDVGFEQEFTRQLELSLDVFYKRFQRLVVPSAQNAGGGVAYGVEWLLRYKPDAHFFGWLSYTLSRSERRDVPDEPSTLFQFDQTHVLALVANCKLGRGWQLGGRFRVTTGDLYTTTGTGAYNASVGSQLGVATFPPYNARLPTFNQLDLRIEKTRRSNAFRVTWFLDLQNAYFANNPLGVTYNYNYTKSAYTNGLPLLPIIGVRVEVQ